MPELGLNAWLAGHFNVPVVFVSGEKTACDQTAELLGDTVVTAAVMEGVARSAAKAMPLEKAHTLIREKIKEGLQRRDGIKPYILKKPYEFEMTFLKSSMAENPALVPGVERIDGRTVRFTTKSVPEGYKLMRALIVLAGTG